MKEIKCYGCGAIIQTNSPKEPGYLPEKAFNNERVLCQRCFKLMHYHTKIETSAESIDFVKILSQIGQKDALVIYIVDLFDLYGSMIPGFMRHVGFNDVLVLANKRDVLPKSLKDDKLERYVRRQLKKESIKPLDVIITSAKKNYNYDLIYESINELRKGRDVYVTGTTNVGKSSFINGLLKHYGGIKGFITVSEFPGTTLGMIKIPLDENSAIYDTPGIINNHQMTSRVTHKDLVKVIPQSEIRPVTFQLSENQTLYFGALARLDYLGDKGSFTCYFSKNLPIHRTKLENADNLYNRHMELKIGIDISKIEDFETISYMVKEPCEIVISGLGFISVNALGIIKIHVPAGIDVIMRERMI